MPGPPMLQGPFRVPSFNGYIPRRLQPWIYLLFAFIFLMSGGIYGGAMSQVMGEYSLMREDVLMIIMFNVVGVAMPFPFLFKMKFHFTNRQLLLNAALVVAACNFLIMWTDSVPVMCILAYIAGFFKLCGTFECMSTIQLWMTSKRDFTIFFPPALLHRAGKYVPLALGYRTPYLYISGLAHHQLDDDRRPAAGSTHRVCHHPRLPLHEAPALYQPRLSGVHSLVSMDAGVHLLLHLRRALQLARFEDYADGCSTLYFYRLFLHPAHAPHPSPLHRAGGMEV